jgi:hypothetical protein
MADDEIPPFELDVDEAPRFLHGDEITDNQDEIDADLMVANRSKTPNFEAEIKKIQNDKSLKPQERLSLMKETRAKQHEFDRNERERKTLERGTTRETIMDEYDMRAEEKIKNNAEKEANKTIGKYNEIKDPKMLKAWQKEYDKVYKSGIKEREEHKKERAKEKAKEEKEIAASRAKAAKSASKKGGRKTRKHGKKGKKYTKKSRRGRKHKTRKFKR